MQPIQITTTSENVFSKTPERGGGYLEIVERYGVDQHGKQWRSFHSRIMFDGQGLPSTDQLTENGSHQPGQQKPA